MMNGLVIQQKIYVIRGQRVMLDHDLAVLYGVDTKRLNESVKRNKERFEGDDFMFRLTKDEMEHIRLRSQIATSSILGEQGLSEDSSRLRSQIATSNSGRGGSRFLPYAFTELGVAMLSSVLRSETAIRVNREIMRTFFALRDLVTLPLPDNYSELKAEIKALRNDMDEILADQNEINEETRAQLDAISNALAELQAKEPKKRPMRRIGFIQDRNDGTNNTEDTLISHSGNNDEQRSI